MFEAFKNGIPLIDIGDIKQGLATADNNRFLRQWFEVNSSNINFSCGSCDESKNSDLKWYPYNKGGNFKKWYGNQNYIINWKRDGFEVRSFKKSVIRNSNFYFHESLSWSKISSGSIGFRFFPKGFLFDVAGCSVFVDKNRDYILGFLNSNVSKDIFNLISPTLNYEVGHVSSVPLIFEDNDEIRIYMQVDLEKFF